MYKKMDMGNPYFEVIRMFKNILICLLLVLNVNQVHAANKIPEFVIYGSSTNIKEVYDIKKQLLKEYEQLVMGLDEEDYIIAIKDYLNYEQVSFDNQTLKIVVGDGNGKVLRGKLKTNYCRIEKEELETHFFFKKIWQKATS